MDQAGGAFSTVGSQTNAGGSFRRTLPAPLIFRNRVRPGRAEARLMWTAVSTWCMNAVGYRLAGDGATQPVRRRPKPVRTGFEGYRLAGAARVKTMGGAADC